MKNGAKIDDRLCLLAKTGWQTRWLRSLRPLCFLGLAVVLLLAVVGCGRTSEVGDAGPISTMQLTSTTTATTEESQATTTTEVAETTTTAADQETMTLRVYFSKDEKVFPVGRVIPKTLEVGAASIKALLEGPTAEEQQANIVSNIPKGTTFLGLDITDGVAVVDLSKEFASGGGSLSMMMRLAEVVFTLTQFPTVQGVSFKLDGEAIDVLGGEGIVIDHPMTRADYEDLSPAILVESPLSGSTVRSPVRITGTANVFEAVFHINIVDWDGLILAEQKVTASSGTGTRGTFDVTVPFKLTKPGPGSVIAFEYSAKDGSQINVVEIPVQLAK